MPRTGIVAPIDGVDVEDAVGRDVLVRDLHGRDHVAAADLRVGLDHLLEAGGLGVDHVVGQHHREGLVADQVARAPDRVAEAAALLLADVGDAAARHVGLLEELEQRGLLAVDERLLELGGAVEIVLERALAARGDEDELLDAGGARLVDRVLDQRPVDQRQDFLRHRLGGRQEPRPETGDRQHRLGDLVFVKPDSPQATRNA